MKHARMQLAAMTDYGNPLFFDVAKVTDSRFPTRSLCFPRYHEPLGNRDTEAPTDEDCLRRTDQLLVDGRLLSAKPDF
jgi:hypothetical protein